MKSTRKIFIMILALCMLTMTGCVYSNNKSWEDLTPEEQEEVRQNFNDIKQELEDAFSGNQPQDKFTGYILDKVEQGMESK